MDLSDLGWNTSLNEAFSKYANDGFIPARVFRQDKQRYTIYDGQDYRQATVLGRLLYESSDQSELPTVGDWVAAQPFDDEAIIHAVLPRLSAFYRKEAGQVTRKQMIAANHRHRLFGEWAR